MQKPMEPTGCVDRVSDKGSSRSLTYSLRDVGSHLGNAMRIQGQLNSESTHLGKDKDEDSLSQEAGKIRARLVGGQDPSREEDEKELQVRVGGATGVKMIIL